MNDRQVLITHADGSQTLITLWAGGQVNVDLRDDVSDTWRPVGILGGSFETIDLDTADGARVAS